MNVWKMKKPTCRVPCRANAQAHAIQVRVEVVHAILKGIDKQSRYQHRKGVVSEDTPIRKRASGEGPFDKSVE